MRERESALVACLQDKCGCSCQPVALSCLVLFDIMQAPSPTYYNAGSIEGDVMVQEGSLESCQVAEPATGGQSLFPCWFASVFGSLYLSAVVVYGCGHTVSPRWACSPLLCRTLPPRGSLLDACTTAAATVAAWPCYLPTGRVCCCCFCCTVCMAPRWPAGVWLYFWLGSYGAHCDGPDLASGLLDCRFMSQGEVAASLVGPLGASWQALWS